MVVALEGWVDAGLGAAGAIAALLAASPTDLVATFDGELLIDQRARRPVARIVNGVTERLTWPTLELRVGRDLAGAEILYLVGPEPDFKWRSFVIFGRGARQRARRADGCRSRCVPGARAAYSPGQAGRDRTGGVERRLSRNRRRPGRHRGARRCVGCARARFRRRRDTSCRALGARPSLRDRE